MADKHYLEQLSRKLADEGRLIEAGWVALRLMICPGDTSAEQLTDMRFVYMAGAQHLFASIMMMLEPGPDETAVDVSRMDKISRELETFYEEVKLRVARPKGSA
jgi:hypothetical protein